MHEANDDCPTFYGKYRGTVLDNNDEHKLGRLLVQVPDVYEDGKGSWAMPAVPYAGNGVGLYLMPPAKASVWVEFEQGNPEYPVWTGCFWWGRDKLPSENVTPDVKVLKTDSATITLSDSDKSVQIETGNLKIVMDKQGIEISNGSQTVKLSSSSVSINNGALEVT
jgi:uncharacterized protein involved in type VI secretion and phage assembly